MADTPQKTILCIDDDRFLLDMYALKFSKGNFDVHTADNAESALKQMRAGLTPDILLMDVIMPGKSGADAYRELKVLKPDLKIIFMSGYTGDYLSGSFGLEEDVPFISKPVSPKELFEKIRNVLDGETA